MPYRAPAAFPRSKSQLAANWLLWQFAVDWCGEKLGALATITWGIWAASFHSLSSAPAWHLLVWCVAWTGLPPDVLWGCAMVGLGTAHLRVACNTFRLTRGRARIMFVNGQVYTFFALCLSLGHVASQGVPINAVLALNGFATYYQLSLRLRGKKEVG